MQSNHILVLARFEIMGGGRNVEFQNVEFQNVDRPKISERQNGLFSWSERRKSKRSERQKCPSIFRKSDQNVENKNINYLWRITYGYQGLWGLRLGSIRLG